MTDMSNEERIRRWRAERTTRAPGRATPLTDDPVPPVTEEAAAEDVRADARTEPRVAPPAATEVRLDDARLAIIERRRERWRRLVRRVMLFLAIPALAVLLYMALVATKLHQGEAVFTVQTSAEAAPAPNVGLFGVTGGSSTISDAFKARAFILSRPMMDHMEERYGFMSHFASSEMDPLTRLNGAFGLNREPFDYYQKRVRVSVDVQQGLLRLYVQARTPEDAVRFGNGILAAAEAHVNAFSDKISEDQIASLTRDVQNAEQQVSETRRSVAAIQARRGELSPEQTATAVYQLISQLELQRAEAERERDALLSQGLTESPLLPRLTARVQELNAQIAEQRRRLVNPGGTSLQRTLNEFEGAQARSEIARARWESTLNVLQQAYLRILEQRRYFVLVVGMAVSGSPAVRDIVSIALPILALIALLYAILFIIRRTRDEAGWGGGRSLRIFERWQRR